MKHAALAVCLLAAAAIRSEQKKHDEAAALYARLASEYPASDLAVEASYRAASETYAAGKPEAAAKALEAFLEKHPKGDFTDDALYDLAWARRDLKDPKAMAAALERLITEFPTSDLAPSAHFLLGEYHYDAKRYDQAATHYRACAKAAKGDELAKALYKLAWALYHAEKLDDAAATFDQLIAKAPDSPFTAEAHYLVGLIRQKQGRHADALERAGVIVLLACPQAEPAVAQVTDLPLVAGVQTITGTTTGGGAMTVEECNLCDDCIARAAGGLCPHSFCPKQLMNGPCGGAQSGRCEVFPDRPCVWELIYRRLKADGNLKLLERYRRPMSFRVTPDE